MKFNKYDWLFNAAFLLRFAGIWIPQLWYDENFTLILARLPFDRMIAATAGDVHPPLWYLIEWTFIRFFPDPVLLPAWTLRLPAFVCSLFAFVFFLRVLNELDIPERVRFAALLLVAILPMQLWYAQEARMYALLELEVILALLFALRGNFIGLFLSSFAMLYTQNYSVFYLASIGLVVLLADWRTTRHRLQLLITAYSLSTVAFLPWAMVVSKQMTTISGRYWIQEQNIGDVLNTIYKLFWASSMPGFGLLSALLVTFMAVTVGVIHLLKSKHPSRWTVLVMAFGPLLMAWIASLLWQPILLFRPLIGVTPFLYLAAVWWVDELFEAGQIKSWREAALASALIVPILVSGVGGYYKNIPAMKNDGAVSPLINALDYVKANWREGDILYYTDDGPMINLLPYAGNLPQYEMIACGDRLNTGPVLGSLSPSTREAIGITMAELNEIEFKRAWVFAPRSPLHPQCYEDHIAPFASGEPLIVVDDNQFITSGVWLIER